MDVSIPDSLTGFIARRVRSEGYPNADAIQRPAARRDFVTHYLYLAEHAGLDVAKRFRGCLRWVPGHKLREGRHAGIRLWPVRDFGNYWIAYHPHRDGIAVERLFHAKRISRAFCVKA